MDWNAFCSNVIPTNPIRLIINNGIFEVFNWPFDSQWVSLIFLVSLCVCFKNQRDILIRNINYLTDSVIYFCPLIFNRLREFSVRCSTNIKIALKNTGFHLVSCFISLLCPEARAIECCCGSVYTEQRFSHVNAVWIEFGLTGDANITFHLLTLDAIRFLHTNLVTHTHTHTIIQLLNSLIQNAHISLQLAIYFISE